MRYEEVQRQARRNFGITLVGALIAWTSLVLAIAGVDPLVTFILAPISMVLSVGGLVRARRLHRRLQSSS